MSKADGNPQPSETSRRDAGTAGLIHMVRGAAVAISGRDCGVIVGIEVGEGGAKNTGVTVGGAGVGGCGAAPHSDVAAG